MTKLDQLLRYAEYGWRLIPCHHLRDINDRSSCSCGQREATSDHKPGKHPRIKWQYPEPGQPGASKDPAQIEAWHRQWPDANWAVLLENEFVIDADGPTGRETFDRVYSDDPEMLPPTLVQRTISDGRQAFYRQAQSVDLLPVRTVPQGRLRGLPGLEVKGRRKDGKPGSYVLVPPSQGREWITDHPIAEPSEALLNAIYRAVKSSASGTGFGSGDEGEAFDWDRVLHSEIPKGERNPTLHAAASSLRARGVSDSLAVPLLRRVVANFDNSDGEFPEDAADRMWERVKVEYPDGRDVLEPWMVRLVGRGKPAAGESFENAALEGRESTVDDFRETPQYRKTLAERMRYRLADRDAQRFIDAENSAEDKPEPSDLKTAAALLAEPEPEYDYAVHNLLEYGDRVIITGSEGVGKTMLTAQLAVQASEGVHPITLARIEPVRALLVDVEIGSREMRRRLRRYSGAGAELENVVVDCRGSLDLRRDSHVAWLEETVKASEAKIVYIGPLYRLASGDPIDETHARAVQTGLEVVRSLGVAVLVEAHCPHGMPDGGRPYGASAWKRWPEFGYCLRASGRYSAWRPPRDSERTWPEAFRRGREGEWPWVAQVGALAADAREFHGGVEEVVRLVREWFEEEGDGMPLPVLRETLTCRAEQRTAIIQTAINDGLIEEARGVNPGTNRPCKIYLPTT